MSRLLRGGIQGSEVKSGSKIPSDSCNDYKSHYWVVLSLFEVSLMLPYYWIL